MKRARFSEEQIIGILKEAEGGAKVTELCRRHGISDATFYTWRSKYGGLEVSEMRRLRQLEASGEVREVGKRWSTEPPTSDLEGALDRLQARTSNIRIVRDRSPIG